MNVNALNKISREVYAYTSSGDKIRVNNAKGNTREIDRSELIACGRIALAEYCGRLANSDPNNKIKFDSKVEDYATFSRNTWVDTILFCSAQANRAISKPAYNNIDEVANDRSLFRNQLFWAALQSITEEVIRPLLPAVMDGATERIVSWSNGRMGETKVFDIESNDFFVFDDDSWGSVSSKPYQYLYKAQISATPKPHTAKCKIKWYQDIIDGEAGRYYAAFARGAANKIFADSVEKFKRAISNTRFVPSANILDGFTMAHWNEALMKSQALNGVSRSQLMAVGTLAGLSQILPTAGAGGAIAGFQGEVGSEFARNGFLANVSGVDLVEVGLGVVPHTQNYDPKFISLDDSDQENIYIMAKVGYAPMLGVMAEGSPITIEFTPMETADMTINISETIIYDIVPAFSNKIFKIEA